MRRQAAVLSSCRAAPAFHPKDALTNPVTEGRKANASPRQPAKTPAVPALLSPGNAGSAARNPMKPPPALRIGALFSLNPSTPRWPAALRAALSVALPVAAGWVAGDISAGFMATIGAFTALYASDRPYANRALVLACIALALALVVSLGVWTQHVPMIAVPVIVVIAMMATFLCNSLRTGPPGAYMFALSCAAGTAMPVSHLAFGK